jgi:beta-lactamase class A
MTTRSDAVKTTPIRIGALSIAIVVIVVGCRGASPSSIATPTFSPRPSPSATATVLATIDPAELSATTVGKKLSWVLDQLNSTASLVPASDIPTKFSPAFLASVSAADVENALATLRASGPYDLTDFHADSQGVQASARIVSPVAELDVSIVVDLASPNLISFLNFTMAADSWSAVATDMSRLASEASFMAAEVKGGSCSPIYSANADSSYAIGSTFKLYVLGELARQVAAGQASWDEQLAVHDAWKSLPSGKMQDEAAGTKHTLAYFAGQMISISDNTAADHLIHRLGRDKVEATLAAMGMADPTRDVPFLLTRDMFVLKSPKNSTLTQEYLAANASGRRTLLDTTVASTPLAATDLGIWTTPRYVDQLEWYASNSDLCRAMASLQVSGSKPGLGTVMDTLAINPGIALDPKAWTYTGFKGGSEPGVLNLTWLLERADGRWFCLSMTLDDPNDAKDDTSAAVGLANHAIELLARVP